MPIYGHGYWPRMQGICRDFGVLGQVHLAMMLLLQAFGFYYGLPVASGLFNYHSVSSGNQSVYAKALLTLTTDMT